jgi:hypothetical protein
MTNGVRHVASIQYNPENPQNIPSSNTLLGLNVKAVIIALNHTNINGNANTAATASNLRVNFVFII